ncbi:hypothetical protein [Flavivirga jejuensis]|uniref:Pyrroloquinoline-quinone binding quinoprotein n=1 Tax=Flavivirga jejuensis TaxID=870487 RepID=A0ABT8WHK7_9FLAO|nr:hypothetical protein [Flavivirga jejuensis]MDO5972610.1 hypothetical protein [Flavivirga jejuensis]
MKTKILFIAYLLTHVAVNSQNTESSWVLKFNEKPNWLSVDQRTNCVYYYDNLTLKAFDYSLNKELWSLSMPNYKGASFFYKEASSLLKINDTKTFSVVSNKSIVINRFTGDVVFKASEIKDFHKSKIFYTKDENFALIMNKEVIKKDKKKNIKRKVNWYLTLVRINGSESLWTIKLPEKKLGLLGDSFTFGAVCTKNTLLFTYDSNLLAYNINDGSLKWERNFKTDKIKLVEVSANNQGFISVYDLENGGYAMNYSSIETGKDVWKEPFNLGKFYDIEFAPNQIIVKCENGFNYLGADGSKFWSKNVSIKGKIEKVYVQGDNHLIINNVNGKYFANWINEDGAHVFNNPVFVGSKEIIEGLKMDDYLLIITSKSILTYDFEKQEVISLLPIKDKITYSIDKKNKDLVYKYGKKDTPVVLKYKATKPQVLIKKVPFTKKNDTITRIESFNGNYSFISKHEVVKTDNTGQEISRLYFKPPSKALKTIASIGAIVLGTVFAKEAGKINRELYKAGLKDIHDFNNEFTTAYYFSEFGAAELGMGVVAGATVNDMINKFEKETKYNPYSEIDKLWMHRDKLDEGVWGLRIVDLENVEELYQLKIGKDKNFNYTVDVDSQIIISSTDKEIRFFKY